MSTFRFLGTDSSIEGPGYSRRLTRFGETVELTDAQAANHAVHGCRLVPAALFDEIGFTASELEINSDLPAHDDTADEAFLKKRAEAFGAAELFRLQSLSEKETTSQQEK